MNHSLKERAERRLERRRRQRIRNRVVCIAAAAVVLITVYLLMMPAVTLEKETVCGLEEHQHTEECYQAGEKKIVCVPQEGALHQHTEACYDESKNLICPWQEAEGTAHTHDESCYVQEDKTVSEKPVCGLQEVQEHVHTEKCFEQQEKTLICGKQEHTHTQECLAKETEAFTEETKASVTQTEADTEKKDQETAAESGKETEGVQETEKTAQKETETETESRPVVRKVSRAAAEALPLEDGQISKAELYYKSGDGDWVKITPDTQDVPGNAQMKLVIDYEGVNKQTLIDKGGLLCYTLPEFLVNPSASGNIQDSKLNVIGTISLDGSQKVLLDFEDTWLADLKEMHVDGSFSVAGYLDWEDVKDKETMQYVVGGVTITVNFESDMGAKYSTADIEKSVAEKVEELAEGDYLTYMLTVTAGAQGATDVSVVDSFTGNAGYIEEFAGVTDTAADVNQSGGPQETAANGKTPGKVYIGSAPTTENPIPAEGNAQVQKPGTLVWKIGDMTANETRTLTYKVKLKAGYTGIVPSNKNLTNKAVVYVKSYPENEDTAVFTPSAGATMIKERGVYRKDPNGGGIISYNIWVYAPETNSYTLNNVRLDDTLNFDNSNKTDAALLPYLTYVEDSLHLYKGNIVISGSNLTSSEATEEIPLGSVGAENNPAIDNGTAKNFRLYIGDLAPGEGRKITYEVKMDEEAFTLKNNMLLKNRARIFSDDSVTGGGGQLNAYNSSAEFVPKRWNRKLVSTALTSQRVIAIPESDAVYECGNGTVQAGVSPGSFTVPSGSFPYTVVVNEAGDWNLSGTTFGDTLGQYLRYTGYVKVDAYEITGDPSPLQNDSQALTGVQGGTLAKTAWVKVDGAQSFGFKPSDLGISGNYAYVLTYYAEPHNVTVASANVNNRFSLTGGVIGPGGGNYRINGVSVDVSVLVQDSSNFGAHKYAWYMEQPRENPAAGYERGTLYWVIAATGNRISSQVKIKDSITTNTGSHSLLSDAVVGVYKGSLPEGKTSITAYRNLKDFREGLEQNPNMAELVRGEDYVWNLNGAKEFVLGFPETIELGENEAVYIIVKTAKIAPVATKSDHYTCHNNISTSGDNGATWSGAGSAQLVAYESGKGYKESQGVYTYDGVNWQTLQSAQKGAVYRAIQTGEGGVQAPGTYLAWQAEVNWDGSIAGMAEVLDELPAGLELVYVEMYQKASYYNGQTQPSTPEIGELASAGWEQKGRNGTIAYYQRETGQVRWNVANLAAGPKSQRHVTFQLVCRLIDQDVLLGTEKTFTNRLSVQNEYGDKDVDYDDVTISRKNLEKEGILNGDNGGICPFTITINPIGEDLVPGGDEITLIDELSSSLILDSESIKIKNTGTNAEIEETLWTAKVVEAQNGSQTLKITMPDNLPLTINYNTRVNAVPGQKISISNVAHWEGYSAPDVATVTQDEFSYQASGTAGGAATAKLVVTKMDEADTGRKLSGAVFTLQKVKAYNAEQGQFVDVPNETVHEQTTGVDGKATFPEGSEAWMEFNTVYCLKEKKAPEGYVASSKPVYLAVAKALEDGVSYPAFPEGVKVWYQGATYQYQATNHKGEAHVVKNFQNRDGNALDGNPPNGAYRFGLFEEEQAAVQPGQEAPKPSQTLTIRYTDGEASYENGGVTLEEPKFTDLTLDKAYYIYELDDENHPVMGENSAVVNSRNYRVTYLNGPVVTATSDNQTEGKFPAVTVTNKAEIYLLPESGGEGVYGYLLAGASLVGAALLMMHKKRKRRGREGAV